MEADAFVLADKEQLLRVFNNLIKNAAQAIPENQKGKIPTLGKNEKAAETVVLERSSLCN